MKNIIVASDLSERSRPAIRRAVELAISADAKLMVLNVVNDATPAQLSDQLSAGAQTILAEQVAQDADGRALDAEIKVVVGDPIDEINQAITSFNADLLILGRHRRRAFLDQIRETTMEHLVRSSAKPVLLVAREADHAYQSVLCGVAMSAACAAALREVFVLAPKSEVRTFHAHEVAFRQGAERDYEIWKAVHPVPEDVPEPIFVEASANDALEDVMKTDKFDLLAIAGHTGSGIGRYHLGSFTASMIRKPVCDVLIAK
jgi:nucleotide-binding universal stress UspA family protein